MYCFKRSHGFEQPFPVSLMRIEQRDEGRVGDLVGFRCRFGAVKTAVSGQPRGRDPLLCRFNHRQHLTLAACQRG